MSDLTEAIKASQETLKKAKEQFKVAAEAHQKTVAEIAKTLNAQVVESMKKLHSAISTMGVDQKVGLFSDREYLKALRSISPETTVAPTGEPRTRKGKVSDESILAAIPDKGTSQTDLAKTVGMSKQAIAPRLKALEASGKVESTKAGTSVIWWKAGQPR